NLEGCKWWPAYCDGADFSGASLRGGSFSYGSYRQANFQGADAREAAFKGAQLGGADFSSARLAGARFEESTYDEHTRFPAGLLYVGQVESPQLKELSAAPATDALGIDDFMQRLRDNADASRLANALKMLKAERFELFAEVEPLHLLGVIKSQRDAALVYS